MTNTMNGTKVSYRGEICTVLSSNEMVEVMCEVEFENGRRAIVKASELAVTSAHSLSWTCKCETCVTARKTLGRMWA